MYAMAAYLFALLVGLNVFFTALSLGLGGWEFLFYLLPTFVPALFLALYFFRGNIGNLDNHEKWILLLFYLTTALAVIMNAIFLLPALFA